METQPLLTRRPICTRCMHGHAAEVITGRENTPTEYHCGYCGNYAVVGVPARWPFMEVVKGTIRPEERKAGETFAASSSGSSPMQVGESLVKSHTDYSRNIPRPAQRAVIAEEKTANDCKPTEEKTMGKPRCEREWCREPSEALFLCKDHFKDVYGITVEEYRANKLHRTETVNSVVRRLKGEPIDSYHKNEQAVAEGGTAETETKPPANDVAKPEKEEAEHSEPTPAYDNKELEELAYPAYHPGRRTFSLAAPRPPIGLVGKDYITIVAREEFIEKIKEAADREFRTPEQQVAYYLHKGMEAVGA